MKEFNNTSIVSKKKTCAYFNNMNASFSIRSFLHSFTLSLFI
jgi:hypothetical protein